MTDVMPSPDAGGASPDVPAVWKWRRNGDVFEGLVGREVAGKVVGRWVAALPVTPQLPVREPDPWTAGPSGATDDDLLRRAIVEAFREHGQYHEIAEPDDVERFDLVKRVGNDVEHALGLAVGKAAVRQKDGLVRICLWLTSDPLDAH